MHNVQTTAIEEWAARYRFDELTADQRATVIAALGSRTAYESLGAVVRAARTTLAAEREATLPDPAIAGRLHAALDARIAGAASTRILGAASAHMAAPASTHSVTSAEGTSVRDRRSSRAFGLGRILTDLLVRRVPAYQALAGAVALVALVLVARPGGEISVPVIQRQVVTVPVRDTIVVVREVPATSSDATLIAAAHPTRHSRQPRAARAGRAQTERQRDAESRDDRSLAATPPRRLRKDSTIIKPEVERPNSFVGLDNVLLLAHQRRGVTIAEDTSHRRFTFAVN